MPSPLTYSDGQILHGSDMNQIVSLIMGRATLYQTSGTPTASVGNNGDMAFDTPNGKIYTMAGGAFALSGIFIPPAPANATIPASTGDSLIPVSQNGVMHWLDAVTWKASILSGVSNGGGGTTSTTYTYRDMRNYNLPSDGSDIGAKINQALNDIKAAGGGTLFIPFRAGGWNVSTSIDLSITAACGVTILGEGGEATSATTLNQVGSNPVIKGIGLSSALNSGSPAGFILNTCIKNIAITVSGSEYQSDGVTPVRAIDIRCAYQLYLENVSVNGGITQLLYLQEVWDSEINRCRFTGGGHCNPFASAGSNGRAVIAALETRCGFTVGVPMTEIWSPDTSPGTDNSNNIRFTDCRWETSPLSAIGLLVYGQDGTRFSFKGCKMELQEGVRPCIAMFDQTVVDLNDIWLVGNGNSSVPSWAPADAGTHGVHFTPAGTAPAVAWFENCLFVTGHNIGGGCLGSSNFDSWIRFNKDSSYGATSGMFNLFVSGLLVIGITGGSLVKDVGGTTPGIVRGNIPPWFTAIPLFYSNTIAVEISAAATPATGTYAAGSRVWYTAPSGSQSPGAVCVTSGSPGVWKTMPALGA